MVKRCYASEASGPQNLKNCLGAQPPLNKNPGYVAVAVRMDN